MHYRGRGAEVREYVRDPPDKAKAHRGESSGGDVVSLLILFLTCFAINADQLISAPNLTQISLDFGLTETERDSHLGALIQLGFFFSAGFFSILSGPVIEVVDRARLIACLAVFGSILSCCSGLVPTGRAGFFYFLLLRVSTGLTVGVALPSAFSLLGDIVDVNQRTTMSAFVTTSCAAGAAVGQAIAGLSSGSTSWRSPYFAVACISFTACILSLWKLKDPRPISSADASRTASSFSLAASAWRGGHKHVDSRSTAGSISMEDLKWSKFYSVLQVPTNRLIFAQSMPGCIAWSSIATFLPDFIHKELGFSVKASTGIMSVFGISGLCCSLLGSAIGQSIYNQNRSKLPPFVAACITLGAIPMLALVLFSGGSVSLTILLAMLGGIAASAGPNLKGMLMNANMSSERGTVFALFNLIDNLGKGLGPSVLVCTTWMSNRRIAFAVAFCLWFVGAWIAHQLGDCLNEDTLAIEVKQQGRDNPFPEEPFDLFHLYHS